MVSLMGPPPKAFLERSEKCRKYWDFDGIVCSSPLHEIRANAEQGNWIATTPIPDQSLEMLETCYTGNDQKLLLRLLRKIMRWLPEERPSAEDLFKDEFIYQDRLGASRNTASHDGLTSAGAG
jgi:hypothetical protein